MRRSSLGVDFGCCPESTGRTAEAVIDGTVGNLVGRARQEE
ncbi:hypothetical protein [Brevibacterium sp. 'Marine']|nr:hypothetical protein [Brevibacterium sp. 'Marine']